MEEPSTERARDQELSVLGSAAHEMRDSNVEQKARRSLPLREAILIVRTRSAVLPAEARLPTVSEVRGADVVGV